MPDVLNPHVVTFALPQSDKQLSDRYLPLSRFWLERMLAKRYARLMDCEELANVTVLKLFLWFRKQEAQSKVQLSDLDCVCRTIAKRVGLQAIRDATRSKHRQAMFVVSLDDSMFLFDENSKTDPQRIVMQNELVLVALNSLDAAEANLLELRLQGWTDCQLACQTGTTTRRIQSLFARIRKKLARQFEKRLTTHDSRLTTHDSLKTQIFFGFLQD